MRSYRKFARKVRYDRRFIWDDEVQAFLKTVLATAHNREFEIPVSTILWRAQLGVDYWPIADSKAREIEEPMGFSAERMKPLRNNARDGRANSQGIPVLYLATTERTAVSEIRPWIGSKISVAQAETLRDLKAVELTQGYGKSLLSYTLRELFSKKPLDASTREEAVWTSIDNAFSSPVNSTEEVADYVPTQILAELFLDAGYDALIYRSQFDEDGYNVAVFDLDDVKIINCSPVVVKEIQVQFSGIGNKWVSDEEVQIVG